VALNTYNISLGACESSALKMIVLYIVTAFLAAYWFLSRKRDSREIPGPVGWPLVGVGLEVTANNMLEKFNEYANSFGDYFLVKIFHRKVLILNSENAIQVLLAGDEFKRHTNDRARNWYYDTILRSYRTAAGALEAYGEMHNKLRKGMVRALHFYGEDGRDKFERNVSKELAIFQKKLNSLEGGDISIMDSIQRSMANIVSIAVRQKTNRIN